jgi:hypothetical protein
MEAAMNSAEANNSFSPVTLLKRPLERIHISRGMLKMRISVMELGRFTLLGWLRRPAGIQVDYAPRGEGTQWKECPCSGGRIRPPAARSEPPDDCVRGYTFVISE